MTPICFIDTETDGVHPGRKIWEIALIRRDDQGEHEQSFYVEIDLSTADPFGLQVGRFYDRHPLGLTITRSGHPLNWNVSLRDPQGLPSSTKLYTRERAAQIVARMTHGAHLVGAVPNFDTEVFDRLLRDHGLCPSWHYHLQDVETLAIGYLRGQGKPVPKLPWSSDELMEAIGVEKPAEDERHTALGDARWAMRTYDKVMGGADQ